jgi:hypothetical protein
VMYAPKGISPRESQFCDFKRDMDRVEESGSIARGL